MRLRSALPAAVFLAAACGGDKAPPVVPPAEAPTAAPAAAEAPASPEKLVRGTVLFTEPITMRPCEGAPIVTVLDSTNNRLRATFGLVAATEEQGMFVIARGMTTARNELVLRELEFAVRPAPGEGCDRPTSAYSVAIEGADSAWSTMITDQSIVYQDSPAAERIEFPAAAATDSVGMTIYQATADPRQPHTLYIRLEALSCRVAKTGAYSRFRATVIIDGRTMNGCGWSGRVP